MKDWGRTALILLCGVVIGCIAVFAATGGAGITGQACPGTEAQAQTDILYQHALIKDLLAGAYDGTITFSDLASYGDFGLGTVDRLDGEMIALDGTFYQVRSDGSVREIPGNVTTPLAEVTFFAPDQTWRIMNQVNMSTFEDIAAVELPDTSHFFAIRADGTFSSVTTRSVPAQDPPYRPLTDVVAEQSVFILHNVTGTVVGIWSPAYTGDGITVPGFHLHFLTDDRTAGGHLLDFVMENGTVGLDGTTGFTLTVPATSGSYDDVLLPEDALALVEQGS